ncbi:type II toxin-antitoxin system RelE/ParE family toxin [Lentisphaera profundi]|uniref:Type II toxin-antitoxin system RelE/ParE family toxin n=1 Tax=Lentisphaera profundi TaxID=1658616 RepID=A0ABY7VVP4_9BACT|nr:type II toxin-antitoxin system RelE/ParE family toxin [Lentisphaera profundi]WDE98147.1 type II toxin-antitoxin system RelE/ParE family toxin [Lentisphaera profundi]
MDKYEIVFHRKTEKELRKIPDQDRNKIFAKIEELSDNPYLFGHIKLSENDDLYRVRQGNYRIIYSIEDKQLQIYIIKIGHRKDIYGQ